MSQKQRGVDHLDISLSLSGLPADDMEQWLEEFARNHPHVETAPKVNDSVLQMNSTDFVAFLGYIDKERLSELEARRLTDRARVEFERLLFNSVALEERAHYKWCLAALKNFPLGRTRARLRKADSKNAADSADKIKRFRSKPELTKT